MSNSSEGLAGAVREALDKAGRTGLAAEQIRQKVAPEIHPDDFAPVLAALEEAGEAFERRHRLVAARHSDLVRGTFGAAPSGNGFLLDPEGEAEFFVRGRHARGALPGDVVEVRRLDRRRGDRDLLPEAEVVRIVEPAFETLIGRVERSGDGLVLVPFSPALNLELPIADAADLVPGFYVAATVERGRDVSRCRVTRVFGDADSPGVDVEVILAYYGIPQDFPAGALAEAAALPRDPGPADLAGRLDLRRAVTITIDGESSRDFDDAVSIERLPDGGFRLVVHIADVAHYVRVGTALDRAALERGTSVYYPERAIPMLPEELSNLLCSLNPGVPRLAVSVLLDIGPDGAVRGTWFAETVIQSHRRMTYGEVRRLLEEPTRADRALYGGVYEAVRAMGELARVLAAARRARGSLDFDLPLAGVELDEHGVVVGIEPGERNVAHRLIEEFMIVANEAVATRLLEAEMPALYRVHAPPAPTKLEELREALAPLGIVAADSSDPGELLRRLLAAAAGRSEESFVSALLLRTVKRAFYSPENRGHFALASRAYSHFTSPIRRYPDLVCHRGLKALIQGDRAAAMAALPLPEVAEETSRLERRSESSERDLLQWKKVRFLERRVGEIFEGRITGVQPFGLFVQLDGLSVDGLVPIRTLSDDFYVYEPGSHRLVGERTGRVFRLADAVEVVLAGVSLRHRGLDLALAGMPPPARAARTGERPGGKRENGAPAPRPRARRRS